MVNCHICGEPGGMIPDPCCSAPDCDHKLDVAHYDCLPLWKQKLEEWEVEGQGNLFTV